MALLVTRSGRRTPWASAACGCATCTHTSGSKPWLGGSVATRPVAHCIDARGRPIAIAPSKRDEPPSLRLSARRRRTRPRRLRLRTTPSSHRSLRRALSPRRLPTWIRWRYPRPRDVVALPAEMPRHEPQSSVRRGQRGRSCAVVVRTVVQDARRSAPQGGREAARRGRMSMSL